jgi:hypothetical protein
MDVLLDFINDVADILHRNVGIQPTPRGRLDDRFIMSRTDGGLHVRAKQRNDASLIFGGYSARRLTLLALYGTGLTCRHTLLHDQMIAAEEPAAQGAQAPANRGRFAATRRALESEWNGEHLSALYRSSRQDPVDDVSCIPRQDIRGAPELRTPQAAVQENSKFSGLRAPATKFSSSRGQNGDNSETKQGRSASRRQAKRSAFVLPAHLQPSPHFLVGHVQVAFRLLDAGVSEHQLNDPDVDAVREQAARAFVPPGVSAEIDPFELFPIPLRSLPSGLRFDAVRE